MSATYYVLCHLHKEKTPSLRVRPDGHWKCFGCGETGHALDQGPTYREDLYRKFDYDRQAELEKAGQLRLPFG